MNANSEQEQAEAAEIRRKPFTRITRMNANFKQENLKAGISGNSRN